MGVPAGVGSDAFVAVDPRDWSGFPEAVGSDSNWTAA